MGSELTGRVEILNEAVIHSSTAHERILRAGHARIHLANCAKEFMRYINISEACITDYDFSVIDWDRYVRNLGARQTHEVNLTREFDLHAQAISIRATVCNLIQGRYIIIYEFTIHLNYEPRCTEWSKGSL